MLFYVLQVSIERIRLFERDRVAKELKTGEDRKRMPLIFRDEIAVEVFLLKADCLKVIVVDKGETDPCPVQHPRDVRLIHPFGKPHTNRSLAEDIFHKIQVHFYLRHPVILAQQGEDGFVHTAGNDLQLPSLLHFLEDLDILRLALTEP